MLPSYMECPGGTQVLTEALPVLGQVDTVVFDVDGVLVDTSRSYPAAICQAVQAYFVRILHWPGEARLVETTEIPDFKRAGGFNDDWQLAQAVTLFYLAKAARLGAADLAALRRAPPSLAEFAAACRQAGGGLQAAEQVALAGLPRDLLAGAQADWDRPLIARLCMEVYGGDDACEEMFGFRPRHQHGPGLWRLEQPLVDSNLLGLLSSRRVGIYTGRVRAEAGPALRMVGFGDLPPAAICAADEAYVKPDPGGLVHLAGLLGTRVGIFCGDSIDDARTVQNYRKRAGGGDPGFLFAGILGGALGEAAGSTFRELGAEVIAPDAAAALRLLV